MIDYGAKIVITGNAAKVLEQISKSAITLTITIDKGSKQISKSTNEINQSMKKLEETTTKTGGKMKSVFLGVASAARKIKTETDKIKSNFSGLGSKLAGLGLSIGAADVARRVYNAGTSEESTYARLKFALGSDKEAAAMMARLKAIGRNSTSPISQIYQNAGFLAPVFKGETDKYLKLFSEVVAGSGGDFGNIAFNFSQIKQAGRPELEDIKQFAYNNIPIFEELGKVLGVSVQQVRELQSEGKISFDHIAQAFENMTKKGGIYYGALDAQANTFRGKMQIIGNKMQELFVKAFDKARPYLDKFADKLEYIIDNFDKFAEKLKFWGELAFKIGAVVLAVKALSAAISVAKIAMIAFTTVANLNPIIFSLTAAGVLVTGLSSNFVSLTDSIQESTTALENMLSAWNSIAKRFNLVVQAIGQALNGNIQKSIILFNSAFSELSSPDNKTSNEYNRLKLENANRINRQIFQVYEDELTGGGLIPVTQQRLNSYFKEQSDKIKANGLGSEYSKALKQVYDAYSIKEGLSTINGVNNSISGSTSGGGSQSKAITINITAPIVQIDSTHIDNKQYTAQQIGEIAAKELVNIMSQVAVQ